MATPIPDATPLTTAALFERPAEGAGLEGVDVKKATPSATRTAFQRAWTCVDWTARLALVIMVVWGAWQTIKGVNLLLRVPDVQPQQAPSSEDENAIKMFGAINSWTAPGEWQYFAAEKANSRKVTNRSSRLHSIVGISPDTSSFFAANKMQVAKPNREHLIPLPSDVVTEALRVSPDGRILVELCSTAAALTELTEGWRQANWEISPLPVDDTGEVPGYHLDRNSDSILVWIVSRDERTGRRTIACSRSSLSERTRDPHP